MFARRLLLFVVVLLLIAAIADAIAPRDSDQAVKPPASALPAAPADVIRARLPAARDVRARVGDVVELDVRHRGSDIVQIPGLGIDAPVETGLPAQLVFDADRPGRFAVSLRDARRRIGVVEVRDDA